MRLLGICCGYDHKAGKRLVALRGFHAESFRRVFNLPGPGPAERLAERAHRERRRRNEVRP